MSQRFYKSLVRTRINDLGGRLDELEREVADIMTEGGVRIPAGER